MAAGDPTPLHQRPDFVPGYIALITPDGTARPVADDIAFPNGMVVTPDNRTLIISESFTGTLTAFDIAEDGGLSRRRVFADGLGPDGICIDAEGAVWTSQGERDCVRVAEGGDDPGPGRAGPRPVRLHARRAGRANAVRDGRGVEPERSVRRPADRAGARRRGPGPARRLALTRGAVDRTRVRPTGSQRVAESRVDERLLGAITLPDGTPVRGRGRREPLPAGPRPSSGSTSAGRPTGPAPVRPRPALATRVAGRVDRLAGLPHPARQTAGRRGDHGGLPPGARTVSGWRWPAAAAPAGPAP